MEVKNAFQIGDLIRDLSYKLKYGDYLPHLSGSSSDNNQEYYGDIDFICFVKKPQKIEEALKTIYDIIVNMKHHRDFYFLELKVQLNNGKKIRFNNSNLKNLGKLEVAKMEDIDFIKLDFSTREKYQFIEVSCIYKFLQDSDELDDYDIEPLKEDMEAFKKDHNYYKALKREYSINNITGNAERNRELLNLFNSKHGELYKKKAVLEAIKRTLEAGYDDPETLKKIHNNLKLDDMDMPLQNIEGLIKKIDTTINAEAKKIL